MAAMAVHCVRLFSRRCLTPRAIFRLPRGTSRRSILHRQADKGMDPLRILAATLALGRARCAFSGGARVSGLLHDNKDEKVVIDTYPLLGPGGIWMKCGYGSLNEVTLHRRLDDSIQEGRISMSNGVSGDQVRLYVDNLFV